MVPPGIEIPGIPARKLVKGGTRMGRPLLFIDFDGVINQFPDPKVMRRQGTTDWMRPDDPRRAAYAVRAGQLVQAGPQGTASGP